MQTKSILMALSAMALVTACTNDETIEMNRGEGISLSAVAGKATRAGSEATTTNSIDNFHVYTRIGVYESRCDENRRHMDIR